MGQIIGYAKSGHYALAINWTETVNQTANTSTLAVSVVFSGNWRATQGQSHTGSLTVNGTTYSFSVPAIRWPINGGSTTLYSTSISVAHATDGTASLSASCTYNCNLMSFSDGSAALPSISCSGTQALTTIARASAISSVSSPVNIGSSVAVKWTPAASTYTFGLYFWVGALNWIVSGIKPASTSAYTYNWTVPTSLYNSMGDITQLTLGVRLTSYDASGGTLGTSSATFVAVIPDSVKPSVSSVSVSAVNSNSAISGWGLFVKGYTQPKLSVSASAGSGSSISKYDVSGAASGSYTSMPQTLSTITQSGALTYSVRVIDRRGRIADGSASITVCDYFTPQITQFQVTRLAGDDTHVQVIVNWSIASVNGKNSASAILQWKATSASSWTTYGSIPQGTTALNTGSVALDEATEYSFRLSVTDTVGSTTTSDYTVSTAAVLMSWNTTGDGVSFGEIATQQKAVSIAKDWTQYLGGLSMADTDTTPVMADFGDGFIVNRGSISASSIAEFISTLWGHGPNFSVSGTLNLTASSTLNSITVPKDWYVYHAIAFNNSMGAALIFGVNGNGAGKLTAYWIRVAGSAPVFIAPLADAMPTFANSQNIGSSSNPWFRIWCESAELKGGYIDFHLGDFSTDYAARLQCFNDSELAVVKSAAGGGGYGGLQLDDLIAHHGIELYNSGNTPYVDFHYKNTASDFDTRIINSSSGTLSFLKSGGYSTLIAGAFTQASSRHVKHDISDMPDPTETIMKLRPVKFYYNWDPDDQSLQYGLIAEEAEKILPSIVSIPDGYKDEDRDYDLNEPMPGIDYSKLVPFLLAAIQHMEKRIEALEEKVKEAQE